METSWSLEPLHRMYLNELDKDTKVIYDELEPLHRMYLNEKIIDDINKLIKTGTFT